MFNLFNFHFHLTVQEIKVILSVGSNDARASVDEVVRAVIGVMLTLLLLASVLSFLSGVILVPFPLEDALYRISVHLLIIPTQSGIQS